MPVCQQIRPCADGPFRARARIRPGHAEATI